MHGKEGRKELDTLTRTRYWYALFKTPRERARPRTAIHIPKFSSGNCRIDRISAVQSETSLIGS